MEATFFIAKQQQALGVRHFDDLPVDPVTEPLCIPSTKTLAALATVVLGQEQGAMQPLRDATCQSFPIFSFEPAVVRTIGRYSEDEIDNVAELWLETGAWDDGDADAYELSTFLTELQEGIGTIRNIGERLYILLEEKAY
ncbi:MAG: hypothetical protein VCB43_08840 [Myxococcota bacterium]|jgi:hypothetical protein